MSNTLLTPSCLAEEVLNKIEKENGEITFPIDPFKLLKDSGVLITFSDFENLEGIILNDKDSDFQLFVLFIEKRIINTIVELHNYLL